MEIFLLTFLVIFAIIHYRTIVMASAGVLWCILMMFITISIDTYNLMFGVWGGNKNARNRKPNLGM